MTCSRTSTDATVNVCAVHGPEPRAVCYHCRENTTRVDGAPTWPTRESLPIVPVVSANGSPSTGTTPLATPLPLPLPRSKWPLWASKVSAWAETGDVGVGDTIKRKLGILGEAFKATMKAMGVECGCDSRRAEWNALYPY